MHLLLWRKSFIQKNYVKFNKNLKTKNFFCKKKEFILIFIISKLFTFEWFRIKFNDNTWKRRKIDLFKSRRRSFDRSLYNSFKKNAKIELFIDEKKKDVVFVNHEFYVNVDVILIVTRSKFEIFKKFVKHHEFIKRILKRKIKKKKSCLF
jgi:hypothetical protein